MFFIKKLNFIRQWFLPQFQKMFYPRNAFRGKHTFEEYLSTATYWKIENHVSLFERKEKRKSVIKTFCVCYFGQHVFPLRSIEAWNWSNADVSKKQTDYLLYWFSENVKNNWNQCISINICLTTHKNVASQVKMLEFWLLDTLKIEKLKLNKKLNL